MSGPLAFHHVGISVPDLAAAIEWYARMLDFAVERRFRIDAVGADVAFVRRGDLRIELFDVAGAAPLPPDRRSVAGDLRTHGTKHVAFAVPDLTAFLTDIRARGADIASVIDADFGRGVFLRDCAGNLIEVVEAG